MPAHPRLTVAALALLACGCGDSDPASLDGGATSGDAAIGTEADAGVFPTELDCAAVTNYPAGSNVLEVGPGKTYATPSAAAAVAVDGDVVEIAAGEYTNDFATWSQNNLTLRGVGGFAHLRATELVSNGKGIWVVRGDNVRIENIEFSGAKVNDENGAGIRAEGTGLSICNGYFHGNENGILGGAGEVLVEYSEFDHNGVGGVGQTHNMYINEATTKFTLRHSYSHHAEVGHNVKTRAQENHILYNRIMDEADGNSSYAIDFSNGGLSYVVGNLLQQSPQADNSTMLRYGAEGLGDARTNELYVVNNTFVNDRGSGNFVVTAAPAILINNLFVGGGEMLTGEGTTTTNLEAAGGLADRVNFDYHLTADSEAIGAGSDPGSDGDFALSPTHQYVHPIWAEPRPDDGQLDIGAYEAE
tara:strand:+ start:63974 stop:65221 length:1248 start_codon:yes stop_codon:yes gene_type:complete